MWMNSNIVIPQEALALLERLEAAGESCWVVGGCVRDSLRGETPSDWDMTTSATPQRMRQIFAGEQLIAAGERHGTIGVVRRKRVYEITTYRVESGTADHRHPERIAFTDRVEQDLARRDFTVNAMAYHPERGVLDCFGGQEDLQRGILRCVGQPDRRFEEDALRVLRALRFVAALGFSLDPQTEAAMQRKAKLLSDISAQRILAELVKLLASPFALRALHSCPAVWRQLLPEIAEDLQQVNTLESLPGDGLLRLIWLCCQLGQDPGPVFCSLYCPKQQQRRAAALWQLWQQRPRTALQLRQALRDFGKARVEEYVQLQHLPPQLFEQALSGCYSIAQLQIDGQTLLELGCPAGEQVGKLLRKLLNTCLSQQLPNTKEALEHKAIEWIGRLQEQEESDEGDVLDLTGSPDGGVGD